MEFSGYAALVSLFLLFALPLTFLIIILGQFSKRLHRRRRLKHNLIISEYKPPLDLSPAEIGYLFDSKFDKKEIEATLVDLEQKGFVRLYFSKINGLNVEKINSKYSNKTLKSHEVYLLDNLESNAVVSLLPIKIGNKFKTKVIDNLVNRDLIKKEYVGSSFAFQRVFFSYFILTTLTYLYLVIVVKGDFFDKILFIFVLIYMLGIPFFLGLALITGLIYNKIVGQPGLFTKQLKSSWHEIEGYREYIRQVELDELKFESEELRIKSKNKALPYAVALNLNTQWQKTYTK